MVRLRNRKFFTYFAFLGILLTASFEVNAACTTPAGDAGQILFQTPDFLFCDGTNWLNLTDNTFETLSLGNGTTSLQVNLATPAGAGSYSLVLPTSDGNANQVLATDGAGVLSWVDRGDFKADGTVPMTGNIQLNGNFLSNDGGNEGISIDNNGNTTLSGSLWISAGGAVVNSYAPNTYASSSGSVAMPGGMIMSLTNYSADNNGSFSGFHMASRNNSATFQNVYMGSVSNAAGASPDFVIGRQTGATAYNESMRILSGGNVGIGTASPSTKLDVAGAIRSAPVSVAAGTTTIDVSQSNNYEVAFTGNTCTALTLNNMVDGTPYTFATNGVTSGTCSFTAAGLTFSYAPANAAITSDAVYTMIKVGTKVYVSWLDNFGVPASGGGDFYKDGSVAMTGTLQLNRFINGGNTSNVIDTGAAANDPLTIRTSDADIWLRTINNDDILFTTNSNERMRITQTGSVGIGTVAPARLLHVNGPMRVQPAALPGTPAAGDVAIDSADSNKLKYYNGTAWVSLTGGGADNLGNHTATQNIQLGSNWLSGDGGNEGVAVDSTGVVSVSSQVVFPSGATSTDPSIVLTGTTNTGLYNSGGDISFSRGTIFMWRMNNSNFYGNGGPGSASLRSGVGESAANPVYTFLNNTTSGMFSPGSDLLGFSTASTERMRIDAAGNVGIGTTTPRTRLDVNGGAIAGTPAVSNATSTVDFISGNIQYTTSNCGAFALHNLKDGTSYSFVVQGTTSATCSFTAYSDAGSTALTVHMPTDHGATTASTHTIYSLLVAGTHVYVAWMPGY